MIIKFTKNHFDPDSSNTVNSEETIIDNIDEFKLVKWLRIDTYSQLIKTFRCLNSPQRTIIDYPDHTEQVLNEPTDIFEPFILNKIIIKRKGSDAWEEIFFNCTAYLMNDIGKTVQYIEPTHGRSFETKCLYD